MNNKAIGIFDSGVGGLSCVKELLQVLPGEDIKYLGDTLRMPYGVKTIEELHQCACDNVDFLQRRGVKLIAAACGTVSSNVPKENMANLTVPFVDVIRPTVTAALAATRSKRIGIIATPATIRANSMGKRLEEMDSDVKVIGVPCPDFVPLIESGHLDDDVIRKSAENYLAEIKAFGADTLILGCTHYPLISKVISEILGDDVVLIDSGKETATGIKLTLESLALLNGKTSGGNAEFFVTNNTSAFDDVARIFLGEDAHIKSVLKDIKE